MQVHSPRVEQSDIQVQDLDLEKRKNHQKTNSHVVQAKVAMMESSKTSVKEESSDQINKSSK